MWGDRSSIKHIENKEERVIQAVSFVFVSVDSKQIVVYFIYFDLERQENICAVSVFAPVWSLP